jgi:ABC-2 type transport system ATP-binding protein
MDSAKIRTEQAGTATSAVSAPAIQVEQLRKTYGQRDAVRNLSFAVQPGEIFALLGPNGAGKTTTVEMLEGYHAPDSGKVRVLGLDPRRDGARLKPRIGVMLQHDGLYPGLRALEIVRLYASFFVDPDDPRALLERVGLREAAHTRCRQLSGGQRRRLALAVAVVGRPRLRVHAGRRLVQKEEARPADHGDGERQTPPLASRELAAASVRRLA